MAMPTQPICVIPAALFPGGQRRWLKASGREKPLLTSSGLSVRLLSRLTLLMLGMAMQFGCATKAPPPLPLSQSSSQPSSQPHAPAAFQTNTPDAAIQARLLALDPDHISAA